MYLNSFQTGMDNIRGVNCCPLSGLTAGELFDAAPVGAEYTGIFLKNKEFTNLPRKFNVTNTGCLENCTHGETQDLGMFPAIRGFDGALGFNVSVGGKMGSGGMAAATPLESSSSRMRRRGWPPRSPSSSAMKGPAKSAPRPDLRS